MDKLDKVLTMRINEEIIDDDEILELISKRCEESEDYATGFVDGAVTGATYTNKGWEDGIQKSWHWFLGIAGAGVLALGGVWLYLYITDKKEEKRIKKLKEEFENVQENKTE